MGNQKGTSCDARALMHANTNSVRGSCFQNITQHRNHNIKGNKALFRSSVHQTVQVHLTDDLDNFTANEFIQESLFFLMFTILWPIYLAYDLLLLAESKRQEWNLLGNCTDTDKNITEHIQNQTVALEAARSGDNEHLNWILDRDVLINEEELIFAAIDEDQLQCLGLLMERGVNLHCENVLHMTPLLHAVYNNKTESARFLLEYDPMLINQRDSLFQRSVLEFCCESCLALNVGMVKLLLTHGANINQAPDFLLTAALSRDKNSEDVVRYILQCNPGNEILNRTCRYRGTRGVKVTSVLLDIVKRGKLRSLQDILHYQVNMFFTNEQGQNALDIVSDIINKSQEKSELSSERLDRYLKIRDLLQAAGLKHHSGSDKQHTNLNSDTTLQNFCRISIRLTLLQCHKEQNLFLTVPKIPMPPGGVAKYIQSYLLYHQNLN